jgi:hypothetical protein
VPQDCPNRELKFQIRTPINSNFLFFIISVDLMVNVHLNCLQRLG